MKEYNMLKTVILMLYLEIGLHVIEIIFDMHQSGWFNWLL